jgi:hypothetical protein
MKVVATRVLPNIRSAAFASFPGIEAFLTAFVILYPNASNKHTILSLGQEDAVKFA